MTAARYSISTEFLECQDRRLFSISLKPEAQALRGAVLFLHPFAEEMHKARRTVAQQARAMAGNGYQVMLLDLSGCGDSSGEFSTASWEDWLQDASHAVSVLHDATGVPVTLWGLRLGALLACDLSQHSGKVGQLLLWQPALNGEQHIDQFLRFELAGQALKGESGFDRAGLWGELRAGRSLQVAGYELAAGLALAISRVRLGDLQPACPVAWIDIAKLPQTEPLMPTANVVNRWREAGLDVQWTSVSGEPFWRNVDAPDSPLLISATQALLVAS